MPAPLTVVAGAKSYILPLVQLSLQVVPMTLQLPAICARVGKVGATEEGRDDGEIEG